MHVEFAMRRLHRCFERSAEATRLWGEAVGRRYMQRIGLLYDAATFADLTTLRALRVHPLKGGRQGQYAIDLIDRWRLIVEVVDEETVRVVEVSNHDGD